MRNTSSAMKVLSLALVIALLLSACTGSGSGNSSGSSSGSSSSTPSSSSSATDNSGEKSAIREFEKPEKVTWWRSMDSRITKFVTTQSETPLYKLWMERVGMQIEMIHPAQGAESEGFSVLIASSDLPDIIEYDWYSKYPGGPQKALNDEVIIDLTPLWTTDLCPNILDVLEKYEEYQLSAQIKSANGQYYVFPCIRGSLTFQVNNGLMLREDWLEELNLEIPKTIQDWYDVLTAFKTQKEDCVCPLTATFQFFKDGQAFVGAYGIGHDFYIDTEGVIQYGPIQDDYQKFYEWLNKFYANGLIDPDFLNTTTDIVNQRMTSGQSGAAIGQNDSTMGVLLAAKADDPTYSLVGAPHPKLNADDPDLRIFKRDQLYTTSGCAAISADSKYPEAAAFVLDYGYSPEGRLMTNFGVEGESYTIGDDNLPHFTDLLKHNPDGNSLKEMIYLYSIGAGSGPCERDVQVVNEQRSDVRIREATDTWCQVLDRTAIVPRLLFTEDENKTISRIMTDINTYQDEMFGKFIMGVVPLSEFPAAVAHIKELGIEEVLEIYNDAYQRLLASGNSNLGQ